MKKEKTYAWTKFPPEVIDAGISAFRKAAASAGQPTVIASAFTVKHGQERWTFDNAPEFYALYREQCESARVTMTTHWTISFQAGYSESFSGIESDIAVTLPSRGAIEEVFGIFEEALPRSSVPRPKPRPKALGDTKVKVKVFIGHGRADAWRDLKDHLADKHGIGVEAYEIGARAGQTIGDVLEQMLTQSSFAVLVLTGEVEDTLGGVHARDNVIHELGLFQGRLGFNKAIALVEEGVEEFSNIHGVQQLRFPSGGISRTFGDVLAVIRREFPREGAT